MSLFDVLSKGFVQKKESNEILSQEEYKDKFYMVMNILKENFMTNTYLEGCQKNSG